MMDGIYFFSSFWEAIKELPDADRLAAYDALMEYSFTGEEMDVTGIAKSILIMAKPVIESRRKNSERGAKGAEAKKAKSQQEANSEPTDDFEEADFETTDSQAEVNSKSTASQLEVNCKSTASQAEDDFESTASDKGQGIKDKGFISPPISPSRGTRFVKPTVEEVRDYVFEKGYHFSAEAFYAFYESNGWKVGKSPMKSWKSACTTWEERRKEDARSGTKPKRNARPAEQHDYNFDDIEVMLLQHQAGAI